MELSPLKYTFLLTLVTTIRGLNSDINITDVTTKHDRVPKAIKRQVKLYSGVRPTPIICNDEGFQEDPLDCSMFHRCVRSGKGRFVSFRFQCSPGTIYDPDTEICNHPEKIKRVACGGANYKSSKQIDENEINQEIPTPISTEEPFIEILHTENRNKSKLFISSNQKDIDISNLPHKSTTLPTLLKNKDNDFYSNRDPQIKLKFSTPKGVSFYNNQATLQTGEICNADGFMGDSENCRKFYRCVGNQRGGFIRYEFLCSDPTIWDEDKQGCNHVWNVKKRRCGRGNIIAKDVKQGNDSSISKTDDPYKKQQTNARIQSQINYGSKVSQVQNQISDGIVTQNQTQINYESGQDVQQNQTQISYGTVLSQSQSQINFGHKGYQTQLQIDHSNNSSQMQSQVVHTTSSTTVTYSNSNLQDFDSSTKQTSNNGCNVSGFTGDTNDCKKFYRCVANGRGSFTRYEFSCGEGTVWDPQLESCNHAWAVKGCGVKLSSDSSSHNIIETGQSSTAAYPSTVITSSTHNYYTSNEPVPEENEISYVNQQLSSTENKPVSMMTAAQPTNGNNCKSSGFIGDDNDCKKFYRCVDNGNGQYTRYEFKCGEGTVWDSKIEACNHPWAVEKCGSTQNNDIVKEEILATQATQITYRPPQSPSHVSQESDDSDIGYGPQQDEFTSESVVTISTKSTTEVTTTKVFQNQEEGSENICKTSGFMGDKKDCQKFYRCVDNGNGSYSRFEFFCGEGTVWDSKNQVCNHASSVLNCSGSSAIDMNEIKTTTHKNMEIMTSSTIDATTQNLTIDDENDIGYGQENNITPSSSTTTESQQQHSGNNSCTSSGFMGDKNDCTKFFRCVENGNGGFTKYEFKCGEGTVWDSKIESCNHAWAVETCGSNDSDKHPEATSEISIISSTQGNQSSETTVKHNEEHTVNPTQYTTSTTVGYNHSKTKCFKSGFLGDSKDCKKFYRCVEDGQGGYIKYEFTCGEGTVWDQSIESCNHEWAVSNCTQLENYNNTNNVESTTIGVSTEDQGSGNQESTEISSTSTSTSKPISSICSGDGFYGDENNCKIFYRCVNNGQGGYTKYNFTCGEGTFWNQDIQACDHESTNKSCKPNISSPSTKEPNSINDEMYSETSTESIKTTSGEYNTLPGEVSLSDDKCINEGFYGNSKNCKNFYRCVSDGKGGYTKYEFTCGEGTIWVQEIQACDHDNNGKNCSNTVTTSKPEQVQSSTENNVQSQYTDIENAEGSTKPTSTECTAEGFYGNELDCTKFYRCVDDGQGGFIKYDFACGEGTAWDSDVSTCNHISEVSDCKNSNQNQNQTMNDEEASKATESTSTTKESSSESSHSNNDVCKQEGYFGNTNVCTKFYRCVDDGKGGFIKYDFDCGEGTIWDQDLTTCNHPQDVANPSCTYVDEGSSTESISSSGSTTQSESNSENSSCSQDTTSAKPENHRIKCEKAGYYANPDDCKKFYRCVDWDGNGEKFSVFHFECGEGTIWDPQLDTCNHEDSVYPSRNCSGTNTQGGNMTQENTTETTTEQESTASSGQMTTEKSTTNQPSSGGETTQESTTNAQPTQKTTTEQTTESSTTESSQITTQPTTQESTSGETTTNSEQSTTSEQTTSQYTTSSSQTTTQQSTTEQTTTEQSTTEKSTTEKTTTEMTTTEETTTQKTTDSENMTQEAITEQTSTTENTDQTENTTENQTTASTSTTESDSTLTTENNQETSDKECPDTEDDQYLYVCPTSFRRHPKYCNMFYQCTEDDENHEVKIATFTCPNNTIYDESKIQCVEEDKADKKCSGQIARKHRVKRLNLHSREPIQGDWDRHTCATTGNHPFEKKYECSVVFLKCLQAKSGTMRGFVYQCPQGYVYWSISRRCEKREQMKYCEESSSKNWNNRWEIPIERRNIAK
ncbi:unnamed protein product [Chilo suppressalis]|uniref:Chitin-binding type-2 domain-containing protein n=1 Tax=Chilo suppressalis TaxID=168631 RepID=A0ABN8AQP1_CHISP|nr:unnamed protein product [Chilo suppressalis]